MFFIVKLYDVFDLGATRFNHRRGFRTVASATLPAARAQLNEEHVSFAWPLALKRSALRRVNAEPEELVDELEDLVEEIENGGKWCATVSVHRAEDGKFVSLLVRAPIFAPVEDEEDGVPGYGDDPAVFFEPAECDELDLRVVARLEPQWGQLGTAQAGPAAPAEPATPAAPAASATPVAPMAPAAALAEDTALPPQPQPPPTQLLWSFGVAFTRRLGLGDWEEFESDPGLSETTEALGSREALYELSRLDWT